MSTDTELEDEVLMSLTLDPRIPDPLEIAVSGELGTVELRGTVESFAQRRAAVQDAKKVAGFDRVQDKLKVDLLGEYRREDDEIRGIILQALMWDVEVPSDALDVRVDEGWVTLKGRVSYQFESDAAFEDAASLFGVVGVTDEVKVITP